MPVPSLAYSVLSLGELHAERREDKEPDQLQVSQSSEFDLSGYIPAVELALDLINRNSCVLPDYHISFTDIVP